MFRNSRYQKLQHSNLFLSRNRTHNNCFEQKIFKKKWKNVSIGHRCFHFQLKKTSSITPKLQKLKCQKSN